MGVTVRQKVRGRGQPWWVFIARNGKRKSIKVGDRAAAEALAGKIQEKLKTGELQITPEKKTTTFGEYARKWLDGHVETSLKFTTAKSYDYIIRLHLGSLKDRPLDQITRPRRASRRFKVKPWKGIVPVRRWRINPGAGLRPCPSNLRYFD